MQAVGKVGKRSTLYPPKELMRRLGLEEGYKIVFRVEGDRLIIEKAKDPWMLALQTYKWAETTVEEFERESEELQE
ncbi:MAG: AbrB/MazE/SpoVT family DNA-binding domain-containing protein, partial [Candidatus Pacebacteria bacterium]|nr:AbrB/MazE/SpoVT family DNA-binding domain-containing protein [Candidatus Paceibacterota bacterium]